MITTVEQGNQAIEAIAAETSPPDGIWYFNEIYRLSRGGVQQAQADGYFRRPSYIDKLDVAFVNLWLSAYDLSKTSPANIPVSWRPLFDARHHTGKLAIQFMVAGLISHIFRDLTLAVYQTERLWNVPLNKLFLGRNWGDYSRVSDTIEQTMNEQVLPTYRDTYRGAVLLGIDALLAGLSIRLARVDAWDRGNTMRLLHPFGGFLNSVQDTAYGLEAAALAETFLTPNLADLL